MPALRGPPQQLPRPSRGRGPERLWPCAKAKAKYKKTIMSPWRYIWQLRNNKNSDVTCGSYQIQPVLYMCTVRAARRKPDRGTQRTFKVGAGVRNARAGEN